MVEEESRSDDGQGPIVTLENKRILDAVQILNSALGRKRYRLAWINKSQVDFAEKNARYMTSELFRNLTDNIKKNEQLASVPLTWLHKDGRYKALSGNHRLQAAIEAGLDWFLVLYTDEALSRSQEVAIQLSHNSLEGADDPIILKELWREIEDVGLKYYAGLDDKALEELPDVDLKSLRNVTLDFQSVTFLFLPEELERLQATFADAMKLISDKNLYIAGGRDYHQLIDSMAKAGAAYDVKNAALQVMLILDVFARHQTELAEGWETEEDPKRLKRMVPVSSVFGSDELSAGAAQQMKKALGRMADRKLVDKDTMGLAWEILATSYLGHGE